LNSRLGETKAANKVLVKASEIGSEAHSLIEWQINIRMGMKVDKPKVRPEAEWAFLAWEDWAKSVELKPVASEQVVYSKTYGYAGTLDLLAHVSDKLTVLDWKTGKAVYSEAHLQNAAYRQAVREMGHGDPVQGFIIRLPKSLEDPKFEAVLADEEKSSFEVFLQAMKVWQWSERKNQQWAQPSSGFEV